ncbi:MAG: hypothetical protein M1833_000185 [Piccolia ochrophora]|nr:MAG: hypothetical protein M1833_000185 [Piccolia ochrophora]
MATAKVQAQSSNRVEPGSTQLAPASYPERKAFDDCDAYEVASDWTATFNKAIANKDVSALSRLFLNESYWRDQLCLSWNYHTLDGPEKIASFLKHQKKGCRLTSVSVDDKNGFCAPSSAAVDFNGNIKCVQAFLKVETDVGRGRGVVRILSDAEDGGKCKAFTLYTVMHELKGHEEARGPRRPAGVEHGEKAGRKNWKDRRADTENMKGGREPAVIIVGAGQGGLTSAARLKMLGVDSLIIDRNERVGDNWRQRYHQLVLHDPVWYDHLPYVPFPEHWPIFTPKDKLGDWFDSYVKTMELNVWMKSTIVSSDWDESKRQWTVKVERENNGQKETRTLHPRHIVQATGHSGEPNFPSHIKGINDFKGDTITHSSRFGGAKKNGKGKHAIVVGCCNSGHDIAHDFFENGYDVTIVQRSSTFVIRSKTMLDVLLGGLYSEDGPPTDDADTYFHSIPNAVLKRIHIDATTEIASRDATLLEGLTRAGFSLDRGPDQSGFFMKYFQRGGGYYIDVGASQLIADGKIKVKQGQEISRINERSMVFADGDELPADEIVFATGYLNMRGMAKKIFGDQVADRVGDVWGFDDEGEIRTMWRPSGHPGFWFFGGNLALCRYYSRLLALQIKAMEEGILSYDEEV